jgi:hypothetical protein
MAILYFFLLLDIVMIQMLMELISLLLLVILAPIGLVRSSLTTSIAHGV